MTDLQRCELRGPLLDTVTIRERVAALGAQITQDYRGRDLVVVGVLKGSFIFMADLARAIDLPMTCDFLRVQSYGDQTQSSGVVQIVADLSRPVADKDVLLVEDIVDTGLTVEYLLANLTTRQPRTVKVCALLHKPARQVVSVPIDYLGFTIEDEFVVGYGLDYQQRYRNLPSICTLAPMAGD